MGISRVEITDWRVFQDFFALDFCEGVNVIIGENGVGKTTLLRVMYHLESYNQQRKISASAPSAEHYKKPVDFFMKEEGENRLTLAFDSEISRAVYIPEKEILEHARGLLTFIEQKPTGFAAIYRDMLVAAQDIPTNNQTETQRTISEKICNIIGGKVEWVANEGIYYMVKTTGRRIPFADEASGYRKLGLLELLVSSGQLPPSTVLLWDEPENSLNPALMSDLADILLELSRSGVQIFVSTHSEILASYFAVNRQKGDKVQFTVLYKDGDTIKSDTDSRFDLLEPNPLMEESVKQYKKQIVRGLGNG